MLNKPIVFCRTVLIANNVQILNKEVDFLFTSDDVKKIKKFANQKGGVSNHNYEKMLYLFVQNILSLRMHLKFLQIH
jgi:hypothetical protein